MNKCPKCHAPARCGPPDGDFRYVPTFDCSKELKDKAERLAKALEGIIKFDDDEGIFDCLEYVDMFKSADFRKTMEQARQAVAEWGSLG